MVSCIVAGENRCSLILVGDAKPPLKTSVKDLRPVRLIAVDDKVEQALWNEYVEPYNQFMRRHWRNIG